MLLSLLTISTDSKPSPRVTLHARSLHQSLYPLHVAFPGHVRLRPLFPFIIHILPTPPPIPVAFPSLTQMHDMIPGFLPFPAFTESWCWFLNSGLPCPLIALPGSELWPRAQFYALCHSRASDCFSLFVYTHQFVMFFFTCRFDYFRCVADNWALISLQFCQPFAFRHKHI